MGEIGSSAKNIQHFLLNKGEATYYVNQDALFWTVM